MHKLKPHKGTLKRVKITGRGKVRFTRAGKSHLNSATSAKRSRQLRKDGYVSKGDIKRLERQLHRPLQGVSA